jgi:hypothetical protein
VILAALVILVPTASFCMRRSFTFQFGVLEILIAVVVGFAASMRITEAHGNDIALWIAFLFAISIGSRGLQDAIEGWKVRSEQ